MSVTRDEWDEQREVWRWPEGENFVVYSLSEDRVLVLDESTGLGWHLLKEGFSIDSFTPPMFTAAARDYFKAHEPKPWLEAKPGEVWVLEWVCDREVAKLESAGVWRKFDGESISSGDLSYVQSARRIWPEVD